MAKLAKHPEFGLLLDINLAAEISGLTRNKIYYREFKSKTEPLPWTAFFEQGKPKVPWYRAEDVLDYVSKIGGYAGTGRLPAVNHVIYGHLTKKEK